MIDLGVSKLALIAVVALIVVGPERLPKVARMAGKNLSDQAEPNTDDYASSILESAPDVTKVYRDALRQGRDSWGVKRTARPLWFKHSAGIRTRVQSGAARVKRFKRPALHK